MQTTRTSFPEAIKIILEALETERSSTVTTLSRKTGLNRRTVEKSLKLLFEIQPYFQTIKLSNVESDWRRLVEVKSKTGLLELPENVQNLIIRTIYYPNPSEEEIVLIHLLLKDAFSMEKALALNKTHAVHKLVEQGQILEENDKMYLSDEGKIVAQGALKIYPELSEINKSASLCPE